MKLRFLRRATAALALGSLLSSQAEDLQARTGLKPFDYVVSTHPMPNYLAGQKWGTEGEQITTMQAPLSPAESALHVVLPEGFTAALWATEPDIVKPVTMAWDERGRLWIAETFDYPNELKPAGEGRDRLKICEDTNGDGKADKFTVFADKLSIPTGICFANGGVIVIESGQTLFLKDTNGDDQADERRTLFRGWGMGDTHATASNLRPGFDNWIWGTVGYSGFDGEVGGRHLRFGMGVFRFKADGSALEFLRSSNNNTWGLGFSEEGTVFGSTANNNASWYLAIPNRFYEGVNGWSAARMETIADNQEIFPITPRVRQVDQHGKYTAGAGHALYTARSFPPDYWNRIAFVTEPTGHLIGKYRLDPYGADFTARNLHTFVASDDEWFAPIMAEVGPDGALWFLDWYNYIVQHNPTPRGFKTGPGNAYETPLRDKRHGRIYRVTHRDGQPSPIPKLAEATTADLVRSLTNPNLLWRQHAQRLLVERHDLSAVPALVALVRDRQVGPLGLNPGALHALWTLSGLGAIDAGTGEAALIARDALSHPSAAVRRTALQVLPRRTESVGYLTESGALRDPDAQVRLAALLALAEVPTSDRAGAAVAEALLDRRLGSDRWLRDAATSAGARHAPGFIQALIVASSSAPAGASEVVKHVARHYASGAPIDVGRTLLRICRTGESTIQPFVDGLTAGWPETANVNLSAPQERELQSIAGLVSEDTRGALIALADRWGRRSLFTSHIGELVARFHRLVGSGNTDVARVDAAQRLVALDDSATNTAVVLKQISPVTSPSLTSALLNALATSRRPETGRAILESWKQLTPATRRSAIGVLLRRAEWAGFVLDALEQGRIHRSELGGDQWAQLRQHRNANLAQRAQALETAAGATASSTDMEAIIKKLLPLTLRTGDAIHGREVFEKNCQVCHALNGKGARVGPDLTGIGVRPKNELLVEIVDPNRSVEANYRLWTVTTRLGDTFAGRLDAETATTIEILDTTAQKHVIQRSNIVSLEASNSSIMPGGFDQLPTEDLIGLLEYLAISSHLKPTN